MSHSSEPFFLPDLLTEVARLWEKPFSTHVYAPVMNSYANIKELDEQGYVEMTRVEKLLANLSYSHSSILMEGYCLAR